MKKCPVLPVVAISMLLAGCGERLVYPVFPAETTAPQAVSFETGYRYENGIGVPKNYSIALSHYREADRAGDVRATNSLGVMAIQGRGSEVNPGKAYRFFKKAAEAGSATARYNLGLMHELGIGRGINPTAAAYEYRMAAEMGDARAAARLASMLEGGRSVPAMPSEARRLFEMASVRGDEGAYRRINELKGRDGGEIQDASALFAVDHCSCTYSAERAMAARGIEELRRLAARGDNPARYNLAVRMLKGDTSNQDPSEAARLFTLAAREGYAPAQRQLAQMHLRGQAVARSKLLAHAWLNLASRDDGEDGRAALREMEALELSMTAKEVEEAQSIAMSGALRGR